MECFYHQGYVAVGMCKNCGKGICKTCAVDLHDGLACVSSCEEKAKNIIELINRNKRYTKDLAPIYLRGMLFAFFTAVLFIGFGIYFQGPGPFKGLCIGIGLLYLFLAFSNYWTVRKIGINKD